MINILSSIEGNKNEVGPTLTAEVEVEGKTVKALLDTGSSVTILSVDLLFNHWAQHKKAEQIVEEWKEEVKNRLKSPSLTLRNYGGNELNILKEVTVKLERGGYSCTAVVFLQKNPPHDLLIGTDLLPSLGFQFIKKTSNLNVAVDIFTNEKSVLGSLLLKSNSLHITLYFDKSFCITVTYYLKIKVTNNILDITFSQSSNSCIHSL